MLITYGHVCVGKAIENEKSTLVVRSIGQEPEDCVHREMAERQDKLPNREIIVLGA